MIKNDEIYDFKFIKIDFFKSTTIYYIYSLIIHIIMDIPLYMATVYDNVNLFRKTHNIIKNNIYKKFIKPYDISKIHNDRCVTLLDTAIEFKSINIINYLLDQPDFKVVESFEGYTLYGIFKLNDYNLFKRFISRDDVNLNIFSLVEREHFINTIDVENDDNIKYIKFIIQTGKIDPFVKCLSIMRIEKSYFEHICIMNSIKNNVDILNYILKYSHKFDDRNKNISKQNIIKISSIECLEILCSYGFLDNIKKDDIYNKWSTISDQAKPFWSEYIENKNKVKIKCMKKHKCKNDSNDIFSLMVLLSDNYLQLPDISTLT